MDKLKEVTSDYYKELVKYAESSLSMKKSQFLFLLLQPLVAFLLIIPYNQLNYLSRDGISILNIVFYILLGICCLNIIYSIITAILIMLNKNSIYHVVSNSIIAMCTLILNMFFLFIVNVFYTDEGIIPVIVALVLFALCIIIFIINYTKTKERLIKGYYKKQTNINKKRKKDEKKIVIFVIILILPIILLKFPLNQEMISIILLYAIGFCGIGISLGIVRMIFFAKYLLKVK